MTKNQKKTIKEEVIRILEEYYQRPLNEDSREAVNEILNLFKERLNWELLKAIVELELSKEKTRRIAEEMAGMKRIKSKYEKQLEALNQKIDKLIKELK